MPDHPGECFPASNGIRQRIIILAVVGLSGLCSCPDNREDRGNILMGGGGGADITPVRIRVGGECPSDNGAAYGS